MLPMVLATNIQTFAIRHVNLTSQGLSCFLPLSDEGMANCVTHLANITDILNPLSPITLLS